MANEINHAQIPTAIGRPMACRGEGSVYRPSGLLLQLDDFESIVMGRVRLLNHAGSWHSLMSPQSLYMFDCHTIPVSAERGGIIAGMADPIQSQPVEVVGFKEKLRAQRPKP